MAACHDVPETQWSLCLLAYWVCCFSEVIMWHKMPLAFFFVSGEDGCLLLREFRLKVAVFSHCRVYLQFLR